MTSPSPAPVRILVIDDHPFLLEGIQALIAHGMSAEVVGHGLSGEVANELAQELSPDIILMDVSMEGINGIEATRQVLASCDGIGIIILTMHDGIEYVQEARQAGARGYVLKSSDSTVIQQAIEVCADGGLFFDPAIAPMPDDGATIGSTEVSLTPRERQVLARLAQGLLNKETADQLCLSVRTVETYRERLMRKLNIHSVAELTRYAVAQNIVPLD